MSIIQDFQNRAMITSLINKMNSLADRSMHESFRSCEAIMNLWDFLGPRAWNRWLGSTVSVIYKSYKPNIRHGGHNIPNRRGIST
jgi:hypothetical protein